MTHKERVARTLAHKQPDRVPIYDKFWFEVEREYREQLGCPFVFHRERSTFDWGAVSPETQATTLWEQFDMDIAEVAWPDFRLRFIEPEVLEETDEWVLLRDGNWAELRWWKHKMGTPEHVRFEIDTPEKWAEVKGLLTPSRDRVRWNEFWPLYHRARKADRFVCYGVADPFENLKDVVGHEIMLLSMIERPEWVHDLFETYTDLHIKMFEIVEAEGMVCDGAFVYGDMAYRNGPFMSPAHYREFVQPCHKRLFDEFHRRGMPIIFHTDGDVRVVISGPTRSAEVRPAARLLREHRRHGADDQRPGTGPRGGPLQVGCDDAVPRLHLSFRPLDPARRDARDVPDAAGRSPRCRTIRIEAPYHDQT